MLTVNGCLPLSIALRTWNSYYSYCMAQNFDRENIDEFDEFPIIHQCLPYHNFPFG